MNITCNIVIEPGDIVNRNKLLHRVEVPMAAVIGGIDKARLAKTTGFQHNCGLHGLARVLVRELRLRRGTVDPQAIKSLCEAFNRFYSTRTSAVDLSPKEFVEAIISLENPIDVEIVLGPVLRSMFDLDQIKHDIPEERRKKVLNPGEFIDDVDVMVLANYLGIRVESYSSSSRVRPDFDNLHLHAGTQSKKLRDRNPANAAHALVLKLWNQGFQHFEYEEETPAEKSRLDKFYDEYNAHFPEASNPHKPELGFAHGLNHFEELRNEINRKVQSRDRSRVFNLAEVVDAHKKAEIEQRLDAEEELARQRKKSGGGFGNLFSGSGMFSKVGSAVTSFFNNKDQSSLGNRFIKALTEPFKDMFSSNSSGASSSSSAPGSSHSKNPGAPAQASKQNSFSSMLWVTLLQGIVRFISKLGSMLAGLMPLVPEIVRSFDPTRDHDTPQALSSHPHTPLFVKYVSMLPTELKKEFNAKWYEAINADKTSNKVKNKKAKGNNSVEDVIQSLICALETEGKYSEADDLTIEFNVKKVNDPIKRRLFLSELHQMNTMDTTAFSEKDRLHHINHKRILIERVKNCILDQEIQSKALVDRSKSVKDAASKSSTSSSSAPLSSASSKSSAATDPLKGFKPAKGGRPVGPKPSSSTATTSAATTASDPFSYADYDDDYDNPASSSRPGRSSG